MKFLFPIVFGFVLLTGFTKPSPVVQAGAEKGKSTDPADSFPVPHGIEHELFYLQRTHNFNTIVCQLNLKGRDEPDPENPVRVFWIRYSDHGERAELSFIQRSFAYGIKSRPAGKGVYELHFAGYRKYSMYLRKSAKDKQYHVYGEIGGRSAIIRRIFIKTNGGTFWSPNVEYVELKGVEPDSETEITERLKI